MSDWKRFGEHVRAARLERGLTLEAVAKVIGSHKGYVSGIEHSKVNPPSWKITRRLCRLLRLDEEKMQLLGWIEKAPRPIRDEAYDRVFGKRPVVMKAAGNLVEASSARALDGTGLVERPSDGASQTEPWR